MDANGPDAYVTNLIAQAHARHDAVQEIVDKIEAAYSYQLTAGRYITSGEVFMLDPETGKAVPWEVPAEPLGQAQRDYAKGETLYVRQAVRHGS